MRHTIAAYLAHPCRGIASAAEREKHSRGEIKVGVHAGKRGGEDHKVHDGSRIWYMCGGKSTHKGTAGKRTASLVPGDHGDHDSDGEYVKTNEPIHDVAHGARNGNFRTLSFAGCYCDDLHAHVAGDGDGERKPYAFPSCGEKASVLSEVGEANCMSRADTEDQSDANNNESDDGRHFDHGEPVFKLSQAVYLHGVERHQSR